MNATIVAERKWIHKTPLSQDLASVLVQRSEPRLRFAPGMLRFPFSFVLVPATFALGLFYVWMGWMPARRRVAIRAAILMLTCVAPFFTRGPGPAQLILGLIVGYEWIRMVAVGRRGRQDQRRTGLRTIALGLITPGDMLSPTKPRDGRPLLAALLGGVGVGACVVLLVLGNQWRLWHGTWPGRLLDDGLVVLEVAVGAAGMHGLIVGVAGFAGRSVKGLLDHPFRSASLSEFWARRWNRMVQDNLEKGFYRPLARAGYPRLGLFAAFGASGVMHVLAVAGAGPIRVVAWPSTLVLSFFLLHGVAVLVETKLGWQRVAPGRGARVVARARTLLVFAVLSPLLIDPFADVANVHGRSLGDTHLATTWPACTTIGLWHWNEHDRCILYDQHEQEIGIACNGKTVSRHP